MNPDSGPPTVRDLDRTNGRLASDTFVAIDEACAVRPGGGSRNTWIAETVDDKLARERITAAAQVAQRPADG